MYPPTVLPAVYLHQSWKKPAKEGAVNISTRKPHEESEASVTVGLGNYSMQKFQVRGNAALSDSVFGSIALTKLDRDGFIDNNFLDKDINGIDRTSGRAKLRWLASDNLELNFSFDFLDEDDRGGNGEGIAADSGVGLAFGQSSFSTTPDAREVDHDAEEIETREFWGLSMTADYDMANDYTFTSITAYREMEWSNLNEEDYTSMFIGTSFFDKISRYSSSSRYHRLSAGSQFPTLPRQTARASKWN